MRLKIGLASFPTGWGGHTGSAPSPFDAINGPRLAGPDGSHPLHDVAIEELLRESDGAVEGTFSLDAPPRVGEGITGTLTLAARERVSGRKAYLRLVGLRLDEVRRQRDDHDAQGHVTHSEHWVEVEGKLFVTDAFIEPAIPTVLDPGVTWQTRFAVPAPELGPPCAHLGESIVAWALEVRWDVAMGRDHFAACYLPLAQNPDLIRAGVGRQGGTSMLADCSAGDGSIAVTSPLPVPAGGEMLVRACWPSASGSKARIELHRRTNAPNGEEGVIASVAIDPAALSGGVEARLAVPPGSAPSFDGAGLEIDYVVRVLIDRRFLPDAAIERPVAIC